METSPDSVPPGACGAGVEDVRVVFERLVSLDVSSLDDAAVVGVLAESQRVVSVVQAVQVEAMARLAGLRPVTPGHAFGEFVADEVAVELGVTRRAAENRVAQSVEMTRRTPVVLEAMHAGVLDAHRAGVITEATYGLDDTQAVRVATAVVSRAEGRHAGELRRIARREVLKADPEGCQRRHEQECRRRAVILFPQEDGMTELTAYLPATDATAIYSRVDALARGARIDGDERSADERRADVFVNLLLGRRDPGVVGEPDAGLRPLVHVTIPASTLAGGDDLPGELDGYGPIPAAVARRIAHDPTGTWRRLVTDPLDGSLLEHGRTTYRPPAALDDHVRARDRECRFPGCQHPARHSDLDHTIAWPKGPTSVRNLAAICRHHHRCKHEAGWELHQRDGVCYWRSPTGRMYVTRPENHDPP